MSEHEHQGHEERIKHHLKVVYARKTHERQVFMEELKQYRRQKDKQMLRSIIDAVGPRWYQALSLRQRSALDSLKSSIYADLLEARPHRTAGVMKDLGIHPRPSKSELLNCIYYGRHDPKEMLAQLYLATFGYPIEGKRTSYCLNARLILSAILYLGLDNLIELLKKKFTPEESSVATPKKPKPKPAKPPSSPYLQRVVAAVYVPKIPRRPKPLPLPNLEELNDPYEEEPVMPKAPPPPPPPPPPKNRLPRSYCDQVAGVYDFMPRALPFDVVQSGKKSPKTAMRKLRYSKLSLSDGAFKKKAFGMDSLSKKKPTRRRKPVAPSTGLWNYQYTINGVCHVRGKAVYILGNVCTLPAHGHFIHGGYTNCNGAMITIHCGFRAFPPIPKPDACDCDTKWHDTVFEYIKKSKCRCGHHYDFYNEGPFPADELPYFERPTRHSGLRFNYHTVYNTDNKELLVTKEFKKHWETDSLLHEDDDTVAKKGPPKRRKKRSSSTCLGTSPRPEEYLKCALRLMRKQNVAARLPDLHLVPELKEWMRRRLYGPLTDEEKKEYMRKSTTYWTMFTSLASKGFGHVSPPKDMMFSGHTTWFHKQNLNDRFKMYTKKYRLTMFRTQAYVNNLLWRTMYQAEFPCETFRKIYFSYLVGRVEDLQLLHPYNVKEATERKLIMAKNRYICLPKGYEARE